MTFSSEEHLGRLFLGHYHIKVTSRTWGKWPRGATVCSYCSKSPLASRVNLQVWCGWGGFEIWLAPAWDCLEDNGGFVSGGEKRREHLVRPDLYAEASGICLKSVYMSTWSRECWSWQVGELILDSMKLSIMTVWDLPISFHLTGTPGKCCFQL